jgi:LysR family nitrogen assimilation transcriptional regulator
MKRCRPAALRGGGTILRRIERMPEVVLGQDEEVEGSVYIGMASSLASQLAGPIMAACRVALPKV